MTKNNRKEYNAPMVEVLATRVERGFEGSTPAESRLSSNGTEGLQNSDNNYTNSLFS